MEVVIKKWGNSATVRIPAAIKAAAHVDLEQSGDVCEEQGRIVIEPVRRKSDKLEDIIGGITGNNLHKPIDTGTPVGKEVW